MRSAYIIASDDSSQSFTAVYGPFSDLEAAERAGWAMVNGGAEITFACFNLTEAEAIEASSEGEIFSAEEAVA